MLLTATQRNVAVRFYAKPGVGTRLGIPALFLTLSPPYGTPEFAEAVAAFQAAHGLTVDGKAGPAETVPVMRRIFMESAKRHDVLVLRGKEFVIPGVRIVNPWSPEGYDFSRYPNHTHGMMVLDAPRVLLLHDSTTRTADACFNVLLTRKDAKGKNMGLGTALKLSPSGTLYQCVPDLAMVTWHAGGGWNAVGVGFDVIALLDVSLAPNSPLRRPAVQWSPKAGYLDYTPAQIAVLPAAVRGVCQVIGAPFDCAMEKGHPAYRGGDEKLDLNPLNMRGVVGHGQISAARWDGNRSLSVIFDSG